jgi:predicted PurR-regulated permease PerM
MLFVPFLSSFLPSLLFHPSHFPLHLFDFNFPAFLFLFILFCIIFTTFLYFYVFPLLSKGLTELSQQTYHFDPHY